VSTRRHGRRMFMGRAHLIEPSSEFGPASVLI
jgi:hypothetical protein